MKKIFAAVLAAVMLFSLCTTAFAVSATYTNTKAFIEQMDASNITYTVVGIDDDGDEKITIGNKSKSGDEYVIRCYFNKDNEQVNFRVWNIIDFKENDFGKVLRAVNGLNYKYKWTKLYVDESDNSVTCAMDIIVREGDDAGDIALEAVLRIANILDDVYEELGVYAK